MTATKLAFLDTETTGLDPDQHEVWEVGLVLRDEAGAEREYLWQLPVDQGRADAMALKIGRWYERRWEWPYYDNPYARIADSDERAENVRRADAAVEGRAKYVIPPSRVADWAALFAEITDGAHLVGAVISFDEERLRRLLRRHHACPTWHYHVVDVEALAAGWLGASQPLLHQRDRPEVHKVPPFPPWDSNKLSRAVGVDPDLFDRHTALGDAKWARAIYDAVMGGAQ